MQRLTVDGKRRDLGLGGYPYVGLADARAVAFANRQVARRGGDPTAAVRPSPGPDVPPRRASGSRRRRTGRASGLRTGVGPWSGTAAPSWTGASTRSAAPDVIAIVAPVMAEKRATGSKLHGWIRAALAWGVAREHLEYNVAEGIGAALPAARKAKKHHAALPYSEVGAALDAIEASTASDEVKACLRFTVLTAVRSGEARGATWNEMDLQGAEWRIPAERMKIAREHRVPLSPAAVETLERARSLHSPAGWCFPAPARAARRIHATTLAYVVKRLYGDRCTVHGFRSSFRDWASEQTSVPHAVAEAALAHQVGSAVERPYARSDLFEKRRGLMHRWAEFVTTS